MIGVLRLFSAQAGFSAHGYAKQVRLASILRASLVAVLVGSSTHCSLSDRPHHNYVERNFYFSTLRYGYDPNNEWIKQKENLLMVHETFKCLGYNKLISNSQWTEPSSYLDVWKPLNVLADSLLITYSSSVDTSTYYGKFWERRRKEGNHEVVFFILNEVTAIMNRQEALECHPQQVNDTLFRLLDIEQPLSPVPEVELADIQYLIKLGMHQSTYYLLSGEYPNKNSLSQEEKDALIGRLDTTDNYTYSWFEDITK